jgi:ATP-binding cassette subfamily F protein uup
MVAQRGAGVSGAPVSPALLAAKEKPKTTPPRPLKQKSGLSFKDRHTLDSLPTRMEELRVRKAKLQSLLEDSGLYARDPSKFAQASEALAKVESSLTEAEENWLTLEMLREGSDG